MELSDFRKTVDNANFYRRMGKIEKIIGMTIEASGPECNLGDICRIYLKGESDKYIFALGEKAIYVYNYNGNEVSKIVYKGEAQGILPTDDFIFIVSLDKISRCFSYGNSEIELSNWGWHYGKIYFWYSFRRN